jgi:hypothetical protein
MGVNGAVAYHDLFEQQYLDNLFSLSDADAGDILINSYNDYWDKVSAEFDDNYYTYAAYGIAYYGLPTQPIIQEAVGGLMPPSVRLLAFNPMTLFALGDSSDTITVDIPGLTVTKNEAGEAIFEVPGINEKAINAFAPILPLIEKKYQFPAGTIIKGVELAGQETEIYEGSIDMQTAIPINRSKGPMSGTAEISDPYPGNVFWWSTRGTATGVELTLRIIPLQYRTATKEVTLYKKMVFKISKEGETEADLSIETADLPDGTVGTAYNAALTASGGSEPYTWESTGLPPGLELNASTGAISGTPTAAGESTVTVTVHDSDGLSDSQTFSLTVDPSPAPDLSIETADLPDGTVGTAYNAALTASGGTEPYTWEATGLPVGLELNASTGAISGMPETAGEATITVTVQDSGGLSDSENLILTVIPATDANPGDGGSHHTPSSKPEPEANVLDSNGNINNTISVNFDNIIGIAAVEIDAASLTSAFDKSKADDSGIKTVEIDIPEIKGARAYESTLPVSFLTLEDDSKLIKINTGIADVSVPGDMLATVNAVGAQEVSLTIATGDKSKLAADVQTQIGNRPVIELNLKIDGKLTSWSNESAPVTITIPYSPTAEELKDPEHIMVWYIDGSGNAVSIPSGRYDPLTGRVIFSTTHFSKYAVTSVYRTFNDLTNCAWAKNQIEVLASKGILKSVTEKEYAPKTNITRADFLYDLVRTLGVDARVDGNFDDISSDAYYFNEIGIAKKLGITTGSGNNKFNPDACITRQDMMTLTERALRMLKVINQQGTASDLERFTDKALIADYAIGRVAIVVKEGLIEGSDGKINPLGNTTRAEAAVFLYRIYNKY